jgi:hypothetical protein
MKKRHAIRIGAVLALALAALWSYGWSVGQRDAARGAAEDLTACEEFAGSIREMQGATAVAASRDMGVQEFGARIETASQQAGLSGASLLRVDSQAARRIGKGPYLRKPTVLSLREITLPQLTTFLYHLTEKSTLRVRDLHIWSPRRETNRKTWDASVTLTYLIYAPAGQ